MDLDQDGRVDIISGSWPGEIYWFRQQSDTQFAPGVVLRGQDGEPINVGLSAATFVTDWHGDGDLDLLIGTFDGAVTLVENHSSSPDLKFDGGTKIQLRRPQKDHYAESAPVVADWDHDGRYDLLLGDEDGSVYWYRNTGTVQDPAFSSGRCWVPQSSVGWRGDRHRQEGQCGIIPKICVTDWNADGRLDLLLGDLCGGFEARPSQLAEERQEERRAISELPSLQRAWADSFRVYRSLPRSRLDEASGLLQEIQSLKGRIARAQQAVTKYAPQRQSHGFVWLFLRR